LTVTLEGVGGFGRGLMVGAFAAFGPASALGASAVGGAVEAQANANTALPSATSRTAFT
jgi:hypothetical protein